MMSADMAAPSSSRTQAPTAAARWLNEGFRQDPAQRGSSRWWRPAPRTGQADPQRFDLSGGVRLVESLGDDDPGEAAPMAATVVLTPAWWTAARHRSISSLNAMASVTCTRSRSVTEVPGRPRLAQRFS